jgi:hypothetical protein
VERKQRAFSLKKLKQGSVKVFEASFVMLSEEAVHTDGILKHPMVVVEKDVCGFGVVEKDALLYFLKFLVRVIMGVPGGSAMDAFIDNICTHDGARKLGCIDADEQDVMVVCPGDEIWGKQAGVAELDGEFVGAGLVKKVLQSEEIGEGRGELEEIVMDVVF